MEIVGKRGLEKEKEKKKKEWDYRQYEIGQEFQWGQSVGKISAIYKNEEYGLEVEFVDDGKKGVCYFNNKGAPKHKYVQRIVMP